MLIFSLRPGCSLPINALNKSKNTHDPRNNLLILKDEGTKLMFFTIFAIKLM
jgi:hypothetical protein